MQEQKLFPLQPRFAKIIREFEMSSIIEIVLGITAWACAALCLICTAIYADGKMPINYAWAFGMIFLIALITINLKGDHNA